MLCAASALTAAAACRRPCAPLCQHQQPASRHYRHHHHHHYRAREALRSCLPELLRNPQFTACLKNDDTTRRWLAQLLVNVGFTDAAAQLAQDIVAPTPLLNQ